MKAPRLALHVLQLRARGAFLSAVCVALFCVVGISAQAEHRTGCIDGDGAVIERVCFVDDHGPVAYGHGVLGDTPEWDELNIRWGPRAPDVFKDRGQAAVRSPDHVYEDLVPRIRDLDGDGVPEIVVVQSSFTQGARLVVYKVTQDGLTQAATPYIGQRYRWLAPAGIGDLDGDGFIELAFVDRPHLAKRLRIWRYRAGALEHVADQTGLTNHRIGEAYISSGFRECSERPEIVSASANWARLLASSLEGGRIKTRDLGAYSAARLQAALACEDGL